MNHSSDFCYRSDQRGFIAPGAMLAMIFETMLPAAYFKAGSVVHYADPDSLSRGCFSKTLETNIDRTTVYKHSS